MIKILMLVNWKVLRTQRPPTDRQPPDYVTPQEPYWFYRYFREPVQVDVLDISSFPALERWEREKLRFYVVQALRAIPKRNRYDLIVSHGMQSGVVLSLWRRLFPGKAGHIVFDIGSFNSAAESGLALKLMQYASHSIDGVIYHTSSQKGYYEKCFPWLLERARFIRFGTDSLFFEAAQSGTGGERKQTDCLRSYILCVGYQKRDWDTLVRAYSLLAEREADADLDMLRPGSKFPALRLVGRTDYALPEDVRLPDCAKLEMSGYLSVRELMGEIRRALFCVLPLEHFNYSFGQMTLLQQMALGKAVVAARVPSMLDYVRDGENALFYGAGNPSDLCEKMERLLTDALLREELGKRAALYVKEEYNETVMAHAIEDFYREVLQREKGRIKRVIFVIVSMAGGGAERVISVLANEFVRRGIGVTILMTAGDTVAYELDPAVRLFCAGKASGGSMKKRLQRITKMRTLLKEERDSVIVSFGPGTSFFAVAADLFLRHPFLISERNDPAACPHPVLRNLIYRRADRLIFQTQDAQSSFPAGLRRRSVVIPNPAAKDLPAPWSGKRDKTVVAVGRLEAQKNHAMLLRAFAIFHRSFPEYTLHIYGKGELLDTLKKQADALGISEYVVWEGFRTDVLTRIRRAGIYALASDYEGISNALLEAMAIGLPAVSTDCPIGGSRLCIEDGKNGLLVPCKDAKAFAAAMEKLASDPEYARRLGEEAAKVRETFSIENIGNAWLEQILSVSQRGKKRKG